MIKKEPKQAEAEWDGVKTHNISISINFKHGKFWCSQNATNQPKSTVELSSIVGASLTVRQYFCVLH